MLFVGPDQAYLAYADALLPSLGEESAQICTLRDLVPEGPAAGAEANPAAAALKSSLPMVKAVERAVESHEGPPTRDLLVETPWAALPLGAAKWAEAFDAAEPGTPHNEDRDHVWAALPEILADQVDDEEVPAALLRRSLLRDEGLTGTCTSAWPLLETAGIIADPWQDPGYLQRCAPWLTTDEAQLKQRGDARAWTVSDLPLLDAARQRVGDRQAARRTRERAAVIAAEQEQMAQVIAQLIESDDSELQVMKMLRNEDLQDALVDEAALPGKGPDLLGGPCAHILVDEAQ